MSGAFLAIISRPFWGIVETRRAASLQAGGVRFALTKQVKSRQEHRKNAYARNIGEKMDIVIIATWLQFGVVIKDDVGEVTFCENKQCKESQQDGKGRYDHLLADNQIYGSCGNGEKQRVKETV